MDRPLDDRDDESNLILASLPKSDYALLASSLENVTLKRGQLLETVGEPMDYVIFPRGAVCSILAVMDDGRMVEGATVGTEGFVGLPVFLSDAVGQQSALCQIEGLAARLRPSDFAASLDFSAALRDRLSRYTLALLGQITRTAGCNRIHSVEERCARWLLMTADRVGLPQFNLTQEFLAIMLGSSRQTVNITCGMLQTAGWIRYRRGEVTIVDREGLEDAACEDYELTRALYARLFSRLYERPRHEEKFALTR